MKYTERAGLDTTALRKAYNVMMVVPKDANDMMQFGRLQGYDVSSLFYSEHTKGDHSDIEGISSLFMEASHRGKNLLSQESKFFPLRAAISTHTNAHTTHTHKHTHYTQTQ